MGALEIVTIIVSSVFIVGSLIISNLISDRLAADKKNELRARTETGKVDTKTNIKSKDKRK
jgi:preprotein translocase subunit SecG